MAEIQNTAILQPFTPLKYAAFWIHQRQDVAHALINQRVPTTDLSRSGLDRSAGPADEYTWAKRTTCLQADCVEFCFGPNAANIDAYNAVLQKLADWYEHKPTSFAPVCWLEERPAEGRFFPEICVILDNASKFSFTLAWKLTMD